MTSASEERIFGTDGVRGRAGEGWLAEARVAALGRAIARAWDERGSRRALLGHDGRRSGPALETALGRGLASSRFQATSAGLITSPGLAVLTRLRGFAFGAMVSASHNPAEDNGIKVFAASGEKLSDELEARIEAAWRAEPVWAASGPAPARDPALEDAYLEHLASGAGRGLDLAGLRIALDCANGGASSVAPRLFARLGAEVVALAAEPDGDNINRGCGSTSPETLQRAVRERRAHLGIALDGDADRCVLVDERGALIHGDGILTLVAMHAMRTAPYPDPRVVATVMSNRGLYRALRELGVGVVTVGVGDRQVADALRRERLPLGGEPSGHVIFGADNFHIGDGLYTALRVLRVLRESGGTASQLAALYRPFPQVLVNVKVARKPAFAELPRVAEALRRIEEELDDEGRVLLRYSGTEALARVMIEGPDRARVETLANELAELIRCEIGAPDSGARAS